MLNIIYQIFQKFDRSSKNYLIDTVLLHYYYYVYVILEMHLFEIEF